MHNGKAGCDITPFKDTHHAAARSVLGTLTLTKLWRELYPKADVLTRLGHALAADPPDLPPLAALATAALASSTLAAAEPTALAAASVVTAAEPAALGTAALATSTLPAAETTATTDSSATFAHAATLALAVGTAPPQLAPRRWCRTFRAVLPSLLAGP